MAAVVDEGQLARVVDHARRLLDTGGPSVAGLVAAEALDDASDPPPGTESRAAANALATAGWDLAARQLGVACADLWGRHPAHRYLPAYRSGLFLSTGPEELAAEAARYRDEGWRRVKMRTGLGVDEDLARLEVVARVFHRDLTVAVDAVNAWTVAQAAEFVARAPVPLLWVEDPVPLADIRGVVEACPGTLVAAGESEETVEALAALRTAGGVGAVLLDVQRLGGPRRFLAAATVLGALGAQVGAHVFTPVSAHLLATVPGSLPLEVFDWSDALYDRAALPDRVGNVVVDGTGLGVDLDLGVVRRLGERVG